MDNVIYKEIWIAAKLDRVFRCFTEEEAMRTWHGREVQLDPVPGGVYKVVFDNGDTIDGRFLEVDSPHHLKYEANYMGTPTIVEIAFIEKDDGTLIKLRQTFQKDQDTRSFSHGWDYFLGILQKAISSP